MNQEKARKLAALVYQDAVDYYNVGMSLKDITMNINTFVEPILGFEKALSVSDMINKSLKHIWGKKDLTANELIDATKEIKSK